MMHQQQQLYNDTTTIEYTRRTQTVQAKNPEASSALTLYSRKTFWCSLHFSDERLSLLKEANLFEKQIGATKLVGTLLLQQSQQ